VRGRLAHATTAGDPRAPHRLSEWFPAKSGRKPPPAPPSTDARGGTLGMQERGRERCRGWGRGFAGGTACEDRALAGRDAREDVRIRGADRAAPVFSMQGTRSFFRALGGGGNLGASSIFLRGGFLRDVCAASGCGGGRSRVHVRGQEVKLMRTCFDHMLER
jgi:hypothetical protein